MTNQAKYEALCKMVKAYGEMDNSSDIANSVIASPARTVQNPYIDTFYVEACHLLLEEMSAMDKKATPGSVISAIKRIVKISQRDDIKGIFPYDGKWIACNGYVLLRLNDDISSLPHVNSSLDVAAIMKDINCISGKTLLDVPTIAELKAYIATWTAEHGKENDWAKPCLFHLFNQDGELVHVVRAKYLLDILSALPNCEIYGNANPAGVLYASAANGDGVLCPYAINANTKEIPEYNPLVSKLRIMV